MIINKLRYLLLCLSILIVYTACYRERTPESYELAPELMVNDASVNRTTVTICVDNLLIYQEEDYRYNLDGFGLYLSESPDIKRYSETETINLRSILLGFENNPKYSLQDDMLIISGLENDKTYYYCSFIEKGKGSSCIRSETKSFTTPKIGINSLEDLMAYRDAMNANKNWSDFYKNDTVNLYVDIDMKDIDEWEPISVNVLTFNGNGHTIKNMHINAINTDKTESYSYGFIADNFGSIVNLNIGEGCRIGNSTGIAVGRCGGICGYSGKGTISNCTNAATIEGMYAGGIVGSCRGTTFERNTNSGIISNATYGGGIVGDVRGDICKFTNNINTGTIDGKTDVGGGIVGYVESYSESIIIERNTNNGDINGESVGGIVGGIAGFEASSMVVDNVNTGLVNADYIGGGILGTVSKGTIKGNTNSGNITLLKTKSSSNVGGIVGNVYESSVCDNINRGNVTAAATVDLTIAVGGIAGRVDDKSTLRRNANSGAVTGTSGSTGGVAGVVYAVSVLEDNTNTATVNGESPTADNEIGTTH